MGPSQSAEYSKSARGLSYVYRPALRAGCQHRQSRRQVRPSDPNGQDRGMTPASRRSSAPEKRLSCSRSVVRRGRHLLSRTRRSAGLGDADRHRIAVRPDVVRDVGRSQLVAQVLPSDRLAIEQVELSAPPDCLERVISRSLKFWSEWRRTEYHGQTSTR